MDASVGGLKFLVLIVFLAGAMYFYEIVCYGLTEEMIRRKRLTGTNIRALVFGASIGAGLFIFAVGLAQSLWREWGGR